MSIWILILSLFTAGESFAYTPYIVALVERMRNPPPSPPAEQKYCDPLKEYVASAANASPEQLEKRCYQQGGFAKGYGNVVATLTSGGDLGCVKQARVLQLLEDGLKDQGTDCDARARSASAERGTAASTVEASQAGAMGAAMMRDAELSIRRDCVSSLAKIQEGATNLAKTSNQESNDLYDRNIGEKSGIPGKPYAGGFNCLRERAAMANNSRAALKSLDQISKAAAQVAKAAAAAAKNHQAEISAITGYDGKIQGLEKKLGQ